MKRAIIFPGQGITVPDTFEDYTDNEQLNIIAYEIYLLEQLKLLNINFDVTTGMSLGFYTSLYCSNVLDKNALHKLILQRCKVMQDFKNTDCSMLAVYNVDLSTLKNICDSVSLDDSNKVYIANYNTSQCFTIAGTKLGLEKTKEKIFNANGISVPLDVSDAFHTPYMSKAAGVFANIIKDTVFNNATIPLVANTTGKIISSKDDILDSLILHMDHSVLWYDSILNMIKDGVGEFIEVGPGHVLRNLIKRIDSSVKTISITNEDDIKNLRLE